MGKNAEAKEMARTCLGFTLEDGAEEIRLIAEYLSRVRKESAAEAFEEAANCADQLFQRSVARMYREKAAALRAGAGEDAG